MAGFTKHQIDLILEKAHSKISVAVETGTWQAKTTRLLRQVIPTVHTIELQPERWKKCVELYSTPGITFHLGDSSELVIKISDSLKDVPVFWYLDAHWFDINRHNKNDDWPIPVGESKFPLWNELMAIKNRNQYDIVVVDDVHAFGRKGDWENVSFSTLNETLGNRTLSSEINKDQYVAWLKPKFIKIL